MGVHAAGYMLHLHTPESQTLCVRDGIASSNQIAPTAQIHEITLQIRPINSTTLSSNTVATWLNNRINPLTLSSNSMGSPDPELPDTTLFVTVFFLNFGFIHLYIYILNMSYLLTYLLYGNESKTCRPGICNSRRIRFFGLTGWDG